MNTAIKVLSTRIQIILAMSVFLSCCITLKAQSNKVDSIKRILKEKSNKKYPASDTTLYTLYYNLAEEYRFSMVDSALHYYELCIEQSEVLHDVIREADCLKQKAWCYHLKGDFDTAIQLSLKALNMINTEGNKEDENRRLRVKGGILGNLGVYYKKTGKKEAALEHYTQSLNIFRQINYKKGMASAYSNIGTIYDAEGDYQKAELYYSEAKKINHEIKETKSEAINTVNIGAIRYRQGVYSAALEYFFEAVQLYEAGQDKIGIGNTLRKIGVVYQDMEELNKALEYYDKAQKIALETGDKLGQASILGNMGVVYEKKRDFKRSLEYHKKALETDSLSGHDYGISVHANNIGNIYKLLGDSLMQQGQNELSLKYFASAELYYTKALQIQRKIDDKNGEAIALGNLGALYTNQNRFQEAEEVLTRAIEIGTELRMLYYLDGMYKYLSELYQKTGRPEKALIAFQKHIAYRDSVKNIENEKAAVRTEMQYKFEKEREKQRTEQAIKDAQTREERYRQKLFTMGIGVISVLLLTLALLVFRNLRISRKQNITILSQKQIIEQKHREVTDSINYAERIQRSFLATKEQLEDNLSEYFIFFKPRDIVSGDFFWASTLMNGNFAFVTADSTGHGVPGAIMSLLNITSLERAIETSSDPSVILNTTRNIIIERLRRDGTAEGGKDGMDCSFISVSRDKKKLQVATAHLPVWIVRETELIEIKADKMPVGKHDHQSIPFTLHEISLQRGDVIYTLTDGFPDQFGGERGKKFMTRNLRELLVNNAHLPMQEQMQLLEKKFAEWKGSLDQTDDVTVVGIRI